MSTIALTRSSAANATASRTPLISADTGAGAWLWASASQVWNGTRPALAPYPISSSPAAIRVTAGSRPPALASSTSKSSADAPPPACREAKYSNTVPRNASEIPVEQMMTYFQVASRAARVRRCPTRNAVATVVASMATHTIPRLFASTARVMAARNVANRAPYWVAPRGVVWPRSSSVAR